MGGQPRAPRRADRAPHREGDGRLPGDAGHDRQVPPRRRRQRERRVRRYGLGGDAWAVRWSRIDDEVSTLVRDAYVHCKKVLSDNRALLDELTELPIEKETVDYQEMQDMITKYHPDGVAGSESIELPK